MICQIRRVWPGEKRTTVIARDQADGRDKFCFVWVTSVKGALLAALCERAEANGYPAQKVPVVLTVKPKTMWGWEITEAELLPSDTAHEAGA